MTGSRVRVVHRCSCGIKKKKIMPCCRLSCTTISCFGACPEANDTNGLMARRTSPYRRNRWFWADRQGTRCMAVVAPATCMHLPCALSRLDLQHSTDTTAVDNRQQYAQYGRMKAHVSLGSLTEFDTQNRSPGGLVDTFAAC